MCLFLSILPYLMLFPLRLISRQSAKEKILNRFLSGIPIDVLEKKAEEYSADKLDKLVKAEALDRIQWHRDQGHRCIIVSASIDTYLKPWAKRHGFQDVIASRLQTDRGVVTGKLEGENCWGAEKTLRLLNLLGKRESFYLYAYGDSRGDKEMLALADQPYYRDMPC